MRKKLVVIENGIIKRILDDSMRSELENAKIKYIEHPMYNDLEVGQSVKMYTDDGVKKPNSELIKLGLITLKDNEILDGETIREKTDVELYKDLSNNEKIASLQTIDTSNDTEYLREKTPLEKYHDNLITKEEYNNWIIEQRENQYSFQTDKLNYKLLFDSGLTENEKKSITKEIEDKKAQIKLDYAKL